ncbi:formate dehydrogenase subunit gamma [Zhaonella formicivorans]|uniref:formate dehydrogenase subunit gamma n=1 Tax=Zhaonella formicivorans TaxID=2528593 RepID=UPI001D116C69|nr:cytochrome b/b6 domain-containing protein [Zhaonella formicivorans]
MVKGSNVGISKVERFNLQQRIQHGLLAISVLMLIVTGFPIKYGYEGWAAQVIALFGGFEIMFKVHLIFAVIMLLTGVYHIVWIIYSFAKNRPSWAMLPGLKDISDAFHHIKYLAGFEQKAPRFGRYTYLEKFEYFAVVWGMILMGLTGFMLWYPQKFVFMPRWAFQVARVAHTNEAFVAMLALFVGHFFAVHFNPKVFPTSRVWLDGTIDLHHLKEEHPLEYEKLFGQGEVAAAHEEPKGFAKSKLLIVTELVIYVGLFIFLLYTFIPKFLHGII